MIFSFPVPPAEGGKVMEKFIAHGYIFVVLMFLYIDRAVNDSAETYFMVLNIINVAVCVVFIIRSIISSIKVIKSIRDSK